MSEEIIKILDALAEKFGLAIDWTSSNVIPYLQLLCSKYINYEIVTSIVWMIVSLIIIISTIIFIKLIYKHEGFGIIYSYDGDDPSLRYLCMILCIAIILFSLGFGVLEQVFDIVTCNTFPEKMIIDELKNIYINMN